MMVSRTFIFMGVSTGQSSIMRIFPRWRDLLGLGADVEITGWDVPIGAPPDRYRTLVRQIKDDDRILGGLITTHKVALFAAARDLLDEVDRYAHLCEEVSCLSKHGGRLLGRATDPIAAGYALAAMLGPRYFAGGDASVLCFGAGGAGTAIVLYLLTAAAPVGRPATIVVTDRDPARLATLRALHQQLGSPVPLDCVQIYDPHGSDLLLERMSPGSLVINATGMGKDLPGSPISASARFPEGATVWELNYRGELDFLRQAWSQRRTRGLRVEDGWHYFILGWTTVMEEVFRRPISADELTQLALSADLARPPSPITLER